jgi:iron complex transport system substrate-binding protein
MQKPTLVLFTTFLLLALLAGCVAPIANSPAEQAGAETATPAVEAEESATAAGEATSECDAGFRLFDHELLVGEPLCIPAAPQRVLPLDMAALEVLMLTGQTPVGTGEWMLQELPLLLPQYADQYATFEGLGYPAELEKVAALQPDLILTTDDEIDVTLAREIAPVVVADQTIYEDWKIGMQFWSEVLNVPELYTNMEANYYARVAELQTALGQPADLEVSIISVSTYGVWLWMPDTTPGAILADVGFARPEAQSLVGEAAVAEYGEKQYVQISEERLELADGDAIFYFTYAATDPDVAAEESAFIQDFQKKPLWLALNAVKAEKAFFVPGYWWRAQTYLLANLVIDDLFTQLTNTTATTPVLEIR